MIETLLSAIVAAKEWLPRFTRLEYKRAFSDYTARFESSFSEALTSYNDGSALSAALMDALENHWKQLHFWNRSSVRSAEKMLIVTFLSPMLLASGNPLSSAFAQELCQEWTKRLPKDSYEVSSYTTIQNGFRNTILGIDISNLSHSHNRDKQN